MKFLISLLLMLNVSVALGAYPKPTDIKFELDRTPYGERVSLGTQITDKKVHILRAQWDHAVQGSTTGSISLYDLDGKPAKLPINSIVTDCLIDVKTAITLNSSFAVNAPYFAFSTGVDGVKDLKANLPASALSTTSPIACLPVGTAATAIRITTESTPILTITSASHSAWSSTTPSVATAGKINVLIQYILSQ